MGKQKLKWKKRFDPGSIRGNVSSKNRTFTLAQLPFNKNSLTEINSKAKQKLDSRLFLNNFPETFKGLVESGDYKNLYQLVTSRKSSRFIGSLDPNIKICITHSRYGLEDREVINRRLPLIIKWYVKDCYYLCVYLPKSIHIYPINELDESTNALLVTHDVIDGSLKLSPSPVNYSLPELRNIYKKFNFITLFEPNEIFYRKV